MSPRWARGGLVLQIPPFGSKPAALSVNATFKCLHWISPACVIVSLFHLTESGRLNFHFRSGEKRSTSSLDFNAEILPPNLASGPLCWFLIRRFFKKSRKLPLTWVVAPSAWSVCERLFSVQRRCNFCLLKKLCSSRILL